MKMTQQHYDQLSAAINCAKDSAPYSLEQYREKGLSDERYRWDLLWTAQMDGVSGNSWVCKNLYPYLNDDHIDTALRQITATK